MVETVVIMGDSLPSRPWRTVYPPTVAREESRVPPSGGGGAVHWARPEKPGASPWPFNGVVRGTLSLSMAQRKGCRWLGKQEALGARHFQAKSHSAS